MAFNAFIEDCQQSLMKRVMLLEPTTLQTMLIDQKQLDKFIKEDVKVKTFNQLVQKRRQLVKDYQKTNNYLTSKQKHQENVLSEKLGQTKAVHKEIRQLKSEKKQADDANSLEALSAVFTVHIAELEEQGEKISDSLCSETFDIENFVTTFEAHRVHVHLLKAKQKKLAEKINGNRAKMSQNVQTQKRK